MAEADLCHLYLLAHAKEPAIKIGVANDVFARAAALSQSIDFGGSYVAKGEREACYRAEKVLHKLLVKHRLPAMAGDGGTEWFGNACKDRALELLSALSEDLGVGAPQPCPAKPRNTQAPAPTRRWQPPQPEALARLCRKHYEHNLSTVPLIRQMLCCDDILLTGSHEEHFTGWPSSTTIYVVKRSPPVSAWKEIDDRFNVRLYREAGRVAGWSSWYRESFAQRKLFSSWSRDAAYWILDLSSIEAYTAPGDTVYTQSIRHEMMTVIAELMEKERPDVAGICRSMPSIFDDSRDMSEVWRALGLE